MIYTTIFHTTDGKLYRAEYLGEMDRKTAWHNAAKMGAQDGSTLLVLVPGNHPVHTYESLFKDSQPRSDDDTYKVFIEPRNSVFEMT